MIAPPKGENLQELFASASQLEPGPSGIKDLFDAILANRPAWHADALCQEHPEVNFFPGRGEDVGPAKRVCGQCLVRAECRAWALEQGAELDGIWAGTSNIQRRQMRAAIAPELRERRAPRPSRVRVANRGQQERRDRPSDAMARCSAFLAATPGDLTSTAVARAVPGDGKRIAKALDLLAQEGYACVAVGGLDSRGRRSPQRRVYRHVRPYTDEGGPATVEATDPPGRSTAA